MHSSGTIAGSMFSGTIAGPMVSGTIAGSMFSGTIAGPMVSGTIAGADNELSWVSASHRDKAQDAFIYVRQLPARPDFKLLSFLSVGTKQQSRLKYSQSLMSIPFACLDPCWTPSGKACEAASEGDTEASHGPPGRHGPHWQPGRGTGTQPCSE